MEVTDSVEMHSLIARNYAPMLESDWERLEARKLSQILPIDDGDTILDVGAGVGRLARAILENYRIETYYALEPSKLALYFTMREPALHLLRALGQQIPLPDDSCDLSFAERVFIHIKERVDQARVLCEMRRVTRPGGFVCLTTTTPLGRILSSLYRLLNRRREIYFRAEPKSEDGQDVYCYIRQYSTEELKDLMAECRLELVRFVPARAVPHRFYPRLPPLPRALGIYDHVIMKVGA